ncbi:MAG: rhomboid family intramembrane serine protease [bacterium]|nr:rhomboid family intramembrane serine protease [bacterium]
MFPLHALRKTRSTPYVTYGLILINVVVFLWEMTLDQRELFQTFTQMALIPCQVRSNFLSADTFVNSLTSMFLHGGIVHLLGNMLFLRAFGPAVEDYLGKGRFLIFYLVAGFMAGFAHTIFNGSCIPTIGASGAIAGVMGGFLLLYPGVKIRNVAFFLRIPVGTVNVQAFYMLLYFFVVDLFNGILSLSAASAETSGVAFWAHVGGFTVGLMMAFISMLFRPAPEVDPIGHLDF